MPRYAQPVSAPAARKAAPSPAASTPANRAGPQRSAKWHAIQLQAARSAAPASAPQAQGKGGLPPRLKAGVERLSGIAMDDVRVHRNSPEPAKLAALAYTVGSDIHLGPGQERHLAHEAWHVVQQKQGRVKPTVQMKGGVPVNDDARLEREADTMGARALASGAFDATAGEYEPMPEAASSVAQMSSAPVAYQFTVGEQLYGALWYLGLTASGNEAGEAAATGMTADYHDEDSAQDVPEEPLKPGDLVISQIEQDDALRLGAAVAQQNPELYKQFVQAASSYTNNPTLDDFLAWYNKGPVTRSWFASLFAVQKKRGPGDSYQDSYETNNFGTFTEVTYTRDNQGCINFGQNVKATKKTVWKNPVKGGSEVQLNKGSKKSTHGVGASGLINIANASRAQHFWIANNIKGNGYGNASPDDWTWHHLPAKYKMVLVDRGVHRKHGHNGGKLLWT